MKVQSLVTMLTILLTLSGCQHAVSPRPASASAPDWEEFIAWWPGTYTNTRQVTAGTNDTEGKTHEHLRLHIARIDNPAFGKNAYYAEWQNADDPKDVRRQRIYSFEESGGNYVLRLHIFPEDTLLRQRTAGAYENPARVSDLTPADMVDLKGCDVYFHAEGGEFVGEMRKGACAFNGPDDGIPIYSWTQMTLGPQEFSYLDGWYRAADNMLFRRFAPDWVKFKKE